MTQKHRALIVDGDAHNLVVASSILDALNVDYKRSTNATKAVEQALRSEPDFILMSLDLLEADPYVVCSTFHSHPQLKHVPVIAMGVAAEISDQMERLQASCFAGFVIKPLIQQELADLVKVLCHD